MSTADILHDRKRGGRIAQEPAEWEFGYTEGRDLHAINLELWAPSQDVFEAFEASFVAPD